MARSNKELYCVFWNTDIRRGATRPDFVSTVAILIQKFRVPTKSPNVPIFISVGKCRWQSIFKTIANQMPSF